MRSVGASAAPMGSDDGAVSASPIESRLTASLAIFSRGSVRLTGLCSSPVFPLHASV